MPITRLSPEQLKEFDQRVQETARMFPGEVVRIRYSFGHDWYGDPAIFFRILLTDGDRPNDQLAALTTRVRNALWDDLGPAAEDYGPFFNIRTKTEQDKLQDPEWE
jgi:hypothetical protein